jgi:hypothetical protein
VFERRTGRNVKLGDIKQSTPTNIKIFALLSGLDVTFIAITKITPKTPKIQINRGTNANSLFTILFQTRDRLRRLNPVGYIRGRRVHDQLPPHKVAHRDARPETQPPLQDKSRYKRI